MSLVTIKNPGARVSENTFFRDFERRERKFFESKKLDGYLLGNPTAKSDSTLMPDILLISPHAVIILDLKDYGDGRDQVKLPPESKFEHGDWIFSEAGNNTVTVKGGAADNPFAQLGKMRHKMIDIIGDTVDGFDPKFIETGVIFQENVKLVGETPKKYRKGFFITDKFGFENALSDRLMLDGANSFTLDDEAMRRIAEIFTVPPDLTPKLLDNVTNRVVDDLEDKLGAHSKISLAAAEFSIYAYDALKKELGDIDELRFLFTTESFTKNAPKKESREFFIPRQNRERSLYGTDFEIKLRNELSQAAIAEECAAWVKNKVEFRANKSPDFVSPFMVVDNSSSGPYDDGTAVVAYNPFNKFTTAELGLGRGHNAYSATTRLYAPQARQLLDNFNSIWNDTERAEDVKETVLESIAAAYKENAPELVYYLAL
jgi:hypothetical protein